MMRVAIKREDQHVRLFRERHVKGFILGASFAKH